MNCLYCDKEKTKMTLNDFLFEEDMLCNDCRKQMKLNIKYEEIDGLKIEFLYDYNSLFKSMLIQYKECFDEALKDVFLYEVKDLLKIKYHGYRIVYIPSTKEKLANRGFDHLRGIFETLGLKELDGLRQKESLVQEGKSRTEREKMINNYVYEGEYAKKVLIVDDVFTTGSSIMGAFYALKGKSSHIRALILSKR